MVYVAKWLYLETRNLIEPVKPPTSVSITIQISIITIFVILTNQNAKLHYINISLSGLVVSKSPMILNGRQIALRR